MPIGTLLIHVGTKVEPTAYATNTEALHYF